MRLAVASLRPPEYHNQPDNLVLDNKKASNLTEKLQEPPCIRQNTSAYSEPPLNNFFPDEGNVTAFPDFHTFRAPDSRRPRREPSPVEAHKRFRWRGTGICGPRRASCGGRSFRRLIRDKEYGGCSLP